MRFSNTVVSALIATAFVSGAAAPSLARVVSSTRVRGTVSAFDGRYDLKLRDRNGVSTEVRLHPGTVIKPRGLILHPGMRVAVAGHYVQDGSALDAREIDAPGYHSQRVVVAPGISPFGGPAYNMGSPVRRSVAVPNH
jgi:hypothetical protein